MVDAPCYQFFPVQRPIHHVQLAAPGQRDPGQLLCGADSALAQADDARAETASAETASVEGAAAETASVEGAAAETASAEGAGSEAGEEPA